ncbi:MAG: hypothetical protein H6835_04715 [Planctomycetes bacterium]|nr:hypothetical protein [Planctomycetota bacterium]
MTETETDTPKTRLAALLHETSADPAAAARALAAERAAMLGDGRQVDDLSAELLQRELRWLEAAHATSRDGLQQELADLRHEWLALRVRRLGAAAPSAAVLLDLAEARATADASGEADLARQCAEAIERGFAALPPTAEVGEEAGERFAALTTALEDFPIEQQVVLLRQSGEVMARLGAVTGSKRCRRLGRRLRRAADDRELARRMERRLGRRGVAVLETTNFVLLLVVLVTLVIENTMHLTEAQEHVFQWIDAVACLFFIADFAFELVLHPSRLSWFARNALTDLVPAIPSVILLLPDVSGLAAADDLLLLRLVRLMRVTWAARYVQALRPLLRAARLLLFLVRGMDGLVQRFGQLLNREFVFVPAAAEVVRSVEQEDRRDLVFEALRREHELVALLPQEQRAAVLHERVAAARAGMAGLSATAFSGRSMAAELRDVPIGEAIEFLWGLRVQDLGRWLGKDDITALDRVVKVLSVVPVRWLPLIRRLAVHPLPASPEERIVALAHRTADWLESWHGRMLFFADLHGIVTGPQILDRVATAMVKATQRPAVRLMLFGSLFLLFDQLIRSDWISAILNKIVGMPLLILGSFCLVFLVLGHWLKRLAGQASENYRLTSEAHFISQLERVQSLYEQEDLDFLTARAFGDGEAGRHARQLLQGQLTSARTGVPVRADGVPHDVCLDANRIALLYLHFLDGAPLHISDVKTTEQLLANQSLENLRTEFLAIDSRERKRLRKLKLDDGSLFSGPYLWFRFITESIAVEAAKRISGYNSFCIPLAERAAAGAEAVAEMEHWLQRRRDPRGGRTPKDTREASSLDSYPTTEFTALDFLGGDPERDRHLAAVFGDDVLDVVRFDRRTMVREIFGTRPVNHLPKQDRSFNPLRFYEQRLSHGRILLAPVLVVWRFVRSIGWLVAKVRQIVREVLDPDLAMQRREIGEAPFAVALRKIHRMKAPGLLEAVRLRLALDPAYSGAPAGWTREAVSVERSELERDLQFLHLREREAVQLRDRAAEVQRQVAALHAAIAWLPPLAAATDGAPDRATRRAGELAVTCAWIADRGGARTLLFAERWRSEVLPQLLEQGARRAWPLRFAAAVGRLLLGHPVDQWLARHGRDLPPSAAAVLRAAYAHDVDGTRRVIDVWRALPAEASPTGHALSILRRTYAQGPAVRRDLMALRTVQSLAVLDIRNYRDLVFRIGDYERDGEDPMLGRSLP